mmetsp:Transcript_1874/g.3904  ORF Transcript_1874/g.3904 Transcript_1874/m.3904 type:complete len:389 (+) Transcript_1874:40-1206(+)
MLVQRRDWVRFLLCLFCTLPSVFLSRASTAQCESTSTDDMNPVADHVEVPRLVAVGDLHGDFENAMQVLQFSQVIDAEGHWIGGTAHLVQTGDIVDRGHNSTALLDFFSKLQKEAICAGGKVTCLLGNHELMILQGDLRYVSRTELLALAEAAGKAGSLSEGRRIWESLYAPSAERGGWLRKHRDAAVVTGEGSCRTLFVHAGLLPEHVEFHPGEGALASLNNEIFSKLAGPRAAHSHYLGDRGPFWYRGFVMGEERYACPLLQRTLEAVGATQMVVGHTVQSNGVSTRCAGRLHMIDVGISRAYGGNLASWECRAPNLPHAIYGPSLSVPLMEQNRAGQDLPPQVDWMLDFLRPEVLRVTLLGLMSMWALRRLLAIYMNRNPAAKNV